MNHYVLFELELLNEKRSRTYHVVFVIAGFCLWFWRTDGTGCRGPALDKGFLKKKNETRFRGRFNKVQEKIPLKKNMM